MQGYTRLIPAALTALALMVPPAFADTAAPIGAIDVSGNLDAFKAAPGQATVLPDQLKEALTSRLADRLAQGGLAIKVKISHETLPPPGAASAPNAVAELTGIVFLIDPSKPAGKSGVPPEGTVKKVYKLTVASAKPTASLPADSDFVLIPPATGDYQATLVTSFADYVAQHL